MWIGLLPSSLVKKNTDSQTVHTKNGLLMYKDGNVYPLHFKYNHGCDDLWESRFMFEEQDVVCLILNDTERRVCLIQ